MHSLSVLKIFLLYCCALLYMPHLSSWGVHICIFTELYQMATIYTQSPIIRTSLIRTDAEFLGKFKHRALGSSNLSTTSKDLRTTRAQIFKAKNRKKWKNVNFFVNPVDLKLWHLKLSLFMKYSAKITLSCKYITSLFIFFFSFFGKI